MNVEPRIDLHVILKCRFVFVYISCLNSDIDSYHLSKLDKFDRHCLNKKKMYHVGITSHVCVI